MVASDDPIVVRGAEVAEGHPQIFLKLAAAEKPIKARRWESGVDFMGDRGWMIAMLVNCHRVSDGNFLV
jgi:hypothetical protein